MVTYNELLNSNFCHTYALIIHTTGEIYTSSCDEPQYPLHRLYKQLDGLHRQSKHLPFRATLIHLNNGTVIAEIDDLGE